MRTMFFPCLLILLDVCAAVMWGLDGNVRKTVYWLAAAILTCTVTF